jgi:hypothetical protein
MIRYGYGEAERNVTRGERAREGGVGGCVGRTGLCRPLAVKLLDTESAEPSEVSETASAHRDS